MYCYQWLILTQFWRRFCTSFYQPFLCETPHNMFFSQIQMWTVRLENFCRIHPSSSAICNGMQFVAPFPLKGQYEIVWCICEIYDFFYNECCLSVLASFETLMSKQIPSELIHLTVMYHLSGIPHIFARYFILQKCYFIHVPCLYYSPFLFFLWHMKIM